MNSSAARAGVVKTDELQVVSISTKICPADYQSVFTRTSGGSYKTQKRVVGNENQVLKRKATADER